MATYTVTFVVDGEDEDWPYGDVAELLDDTADQLSATWSDDGDINLDVSGGDRHVTGKFYLSRARQARRSGPPGGPGEAERMARERRAADDAARWAAARKHGDGYVLRP